MKPIELAQMARQVADTLAHLTTEQKNKTLTILSNLLHEKKQYLINANKKDISNAKRDGLAQNLIERLQLNEKVINEMRASIQDVVNLPDPVGEIVALWERPNGLRVGKMRIPIGVIFVIYESRPNVTVEAFSLCLKSGNYVILKGGSEAYYSNQAIFNLIKEALKGAGMPYNAAHLVETTNRSYIYELLKLDNFIDLVIPRGGEDLMRNVMDHSHIPVLKHYKGICHIFIDEWARKELAYSICLNAKVQKPATCNAMETLLVHEAIAETFLPDMIKIFRKNKVMLKGCDKTRAIIKDIEKADEKDWHEEYLDLTLSIKIVKSLDEAIFHIRKYGSDHTDAIITENYSNAWKFLREVNSSLVLVNASTRLNDGYQLGLGAEMGISTTKVHAFGPMGLNELTVTKFIAFGDGQVRV